MASQPYYINLHSIDRAFPPGVETPQLLLDFAAWLDGRPWGSVRQFVEAAVVTGDMALPFHYPRLQELDAWQIGFRQHGLTGEDLTSSAPGAWRPGWRVIALNGFDDPFFIDLGEEAQGFPVYYAPHGAGRWDALQAAPDIHRFGEMLSALREVADDDSKVMQYIETETGATNELWREVHESRRDRLGAEQEPPQNETPPDPEAWRRGALILASAGPQRLKVAQVLKQMLNLSPQEALALAAKRDVTIAEGSFGSLRGAHSRLVDLGAAVEFRPQGPCTKNSSTG